MMGNYKRTKGTIGTSLIVKDTNAAGNDDESGATAQAVDDPWEVDANHPHTTED